jgi:TatA/E family protein of Tat protein translocase
MLSIPHLIVIFIVALVVFGPEKLPELARMLGRAMGEVRRMTAEMRGTFDEHMRELERETAQRAQDAPAAKVAPAATTPASVAQTNDSPTANSTPSEPERGKTTPGTPDPVAHTNDPPAPNSTSTQPEKTKDGDTRPA